MLVRATIYWRCCGPGIRNPFDDIILMRMEKKIVESDQLTNNLDVLYLYYVVVVESFMPCIQMIARFYIVEMITCRLIDSDDLIFKHPNHNFERQVKIAVAHYCWLSRIRKLDIIDILEKKWEIGVQLIYDTHCHAFQICT